MMMVKPDEAQNLPDKRILHKMPAVFVFPKKSPQIQNKN
jgi:hypothetical protein